MRMVYPLSWPDGWPRHQGDRESGVFKVTLAKARNELVRGLILFGAESVEITSNAQLNRLGEINHRQGAIVDPGVSMYFVKDDHERCIATDRFTTIDANVRACGLVVEALRGIARWGGGIAEASIAGFQALPAGGESGWWTVLGLSAHPRREHVEAAYRELAKRHHPDSGGDPEMFRTIQAAYDQGKEATR